MNTYHIPAVYHPKRHYQRDKQEIDAAIWGVLDRGAFVMGREVAAFEREFSAYCQAAYGVAVTSGTAALHIALLTAEIGPGDEVIGVATADKAISLAVENAGADLKWVDIDQQTFNMDPNALQAALTPKTRAVIVAHMYGLPADITAIRSVLADRKDIILIEDGALAIGADSPAGRVGSLGDMACFSIASSKVLGCVGAGGVLTTNHEEFYVKANWVRNYGTASSPYKEEDPMPTRQEKGLVIRGVNERLDTIQAAVARVKLKHLDRDLAKRRANAKIYDRFFSDLACETPYIPQGYTHSFRTYPLLVEASIRDRCLQQLNERGIEAGAHYIPPDHLHPYFLKRGGYRGQLPVTEEVADRIVCLPVHQYLESDEIAYVIHHTKEVMQSLG